MDLILNRDPETSLLKLEGRFTFESHSAFRMATQELLDAEETSEIVLDLSGLSYLDSSSLGMLLLLRDKSEARGLKVALLNPSPAVAGILKVVQFGKLFEIREG